MRSRGRPGGEGTAGSEVTGSEVTARTGPPTGAGDFARPGLGDRSAGSFIRTPHAPGTAAASPSAASGRVRPLGARPWPERKALSGLGVLQTTDLLQASRPYLFAGVLKRVGWWWGRSGTSPARCGVALATVCPLVSQRQVQESGTPGMQPPPHTPPDPWCSSSCARHVTSMSGFPLSADGRSGGHPRVIERLTVVESLGEGLLACVAITWVPAQASRDLRDLSGRSSAARLMPSLLCVAWLWDGLCKGRVVHFFNGSLSLMKKYRRQVMVSDGRRKFRPY